MGKSGGWKINGIFYFKFNFVLLELKFLLKKKNVNKIISNREQNKIHFNFFFNGLNYPIP